VGAPETLPAPLTADGAYRMIVRRLEEGPAPDGVVAASDVIAMSAVRALIERGLRVPADVGVVGYDDVLLAAHTTPPLTTIRQDLARGAGLLVELLFKVLAGAPAQSAVLAPTLVVRGSTVVTPAAP
jgi:DNA-binding LacI/PurR family transcriptional regulator